MPSILLAVNKEYFSGEKHQQRTWSYLVQSQVSHHSLMRSKQHQLLHQHTSKLHKIIIPRGLMPSNIMLFCTHPFSLSIFWNSVLLDCTLPCASFLSFYPTPLFQMCIFSVKKTQKTNKTVSTFWWSFFGLFFCYVWGFFVVFFLCSRNALFCAPWSREVQLSQLLVHSEKFANLE